jgi:hypothetical protein
MGSVVSTKRPSVLCDVISVVTEFMVNAAQVESSAIHVTSSVW